MHGQPLAGVEQLHEQGRVRAEGGHVRVAEPVGRVRGDRVPQQFAVGERGEPGGCSPWSVVQDATQSSGPNSFGSSPRSAAMAAPPR